MNNYLPSGYKSLQEFIIYGRVSPSKVPSVCPTPAKLPDKLETIPPRHQYYEEFMDADVNPSLLEKPPFLPDKK